MKTSKQTVHLVDSMGSDLSVVNAARVSFAKESEWVVTPVGNEESWDVVASLSAQDQKLINYLAKHNHWTPFAHAFASFRIKAPIFVARQLVKHQVGLAWNEVSRRYVDDEPEFYFPDVWRGKPENVKQGSDGIITDPSITFDVKDIVEGCLNTYIALIKDGVAPEQSRMVLPQNTMTEWIWSGSLAAFARVCKLRMDSHAQQETQEVAKMIYNQLMPIYPVAFKALLDVSE